MYQFVKFRMADDIFVGDYLSVSALACSTFGGAVVIDSSWP
jgi:hypothetical protein